MSRSTQKLPPIFPRLSSAICNQPFVPLHFSGSRAANYHYSRVRAFFNTAADARFVKRPAPCRCRIQTAWHGVCFWSFPRTLWIECAFLAAFDKSLFVSSCACPPIPALVHLHHSLYCLSLACSFFNLSTQPSLFLCKLVIWNSAPLSFAMWNSVPLSFVGPLLTGTVFHLVSCVLVLQSRLRGMFVSLEWGI